MRKDAIKFFAGVATGAALTIAAKKFMETRTGRTLKQSVRDVKADFYKSIMPKLRDMKYASEEDYREFMEQAAEKYSKAKKLPADIARRLIAEAQDSWDYFTEYFNKE